MHCNAPPFKPTARIRRTAGARLRDAVYAMSGGKAAIIRHGEQNWASITFAGARHGIELMFDGAEAVEAGEVFIAALPDHEFSIPGQLVAEAAVTAVEHRLDPPRMHVSCEVLLLEDA